MLEQLHLRLRAEAALPAPAQPRGLRRPRRDHRQRHQALRAVRAVDQAGRDEVRARYQVRSAARDTPVWEDAS
ncbi:hypothetical protein [Pseudofrankia sp. DC12]|uniref:hypothetical protein n=1 Tax=Pseudofrankia sp. DC12 TaxID=683315 RepID=UPI000A8DE14F|nr:hypothetical protein [Pseudofrankia sp. DC12]